MASPGADGDTDMEQCPQEWQGHDAVNGSMDAAAVAAAAAAQAEEQGMELEAATAAAMEAAAAAAAQAAAAAAGDAEGADGEDGSGEGEPAGDGSPQPPAHANGAEQLSYAAIREAAAVNQAADGAADEAMRAVAAAQHALQVLMSTPGPAEMLAAGMMAMEDDAGSSGRSGRSRRKTHAYMEAMGYGHAVYAPGGRPNKGLRHFSMKVCEKVESKGTTSYNEVADELVAELKDCSLEDGVIYDEKNIRRRVYDAINVLMAMDIITKERKAIMWKGFPTTRSPAQLVGRLQNEQYAAMSEVGRKAQYLADLVEQQRALKHLLERNSRQPDSNTGTALHLPFILVQSKHDATVEVQIADDMRDVQFNFYNYPFEIHDDALVLRKMLEYDNLQKMGAMGLDGAMPMSIDGQMLTPEQLAYMQQQQAMMAAAAAAAGQPY